MGPLVSVVIPTRNRAHFLREAIDSVLAQEYHTECIVVDGGSTDGTQALLASYGARIRWLSEPDSGPYEAIEKGWAMTDAPIISWLNDDDYWLPGAVSTVVRHFAVSPAPAVVYGSCLGVDTGGRVVWWERARQWTLDAAVVGMDHVINQPAAFLSREAVARAGGLAYHWIHDHELWIRIGLEGGRFVAIPDLLAAVRIHDGNASMAPRFAVEQKLKLVERTFADPRLPAPIARERRRAVSNAYLRGLHYLRPGRPGDWLLAGRWLAQAIAACPANAPAALARPLRLALQKARRRRELAKLPVPPPKPREASVVNPGTAAPTDSVTRSQP
jgi:glycosyltransferase involved in cell wall biosynthesis